MRKLSILVLVTFLILGVGCGKSGEDSSSLDGHPPAKSPADKVTAEPGAHEGAGEKLKTEGDEEIDVDKLDIPDRLKQAIKSGRIPKERVQEMLARFREGGTPGAGGGGMAATPVSVPNAGVMEAAGDTFHELPSHRSIRGCMACACVEDAC